jgi:hypothetical protein
LAPTDYYGISSPFGNQRPRGQNEMEKIPDEAGMCIRINKSHFREAGMSFRISRASDERTHLRSRNVVENT